MNFNLTRYEASEGKVFDLKDSADGEHLYAKIVYVSEKDSINKYIEVDIPEEE